MAMTRFGTGQLSRTVQLLEELDKDVIVRGALRRTAAFCKCWAKSTVTGCEVNVEGLVGNVHGLGLSIEFLGLCHSRVFPVGHDAAGLRHVDFV